MFGHTYNPNYFINPPAYTYLLHGAFALGFGGRDGVSEAFAKDPGDVFAVARALSAVLGAAAVGLLAWAGARLFDRRVGLVAAALLGGRLPARALRPLRAQRRARRWRPSASRWSASPVSTAAGRLGDYALAGAGLGLACATKYTGGIVLLPLLAATLVGPGQSDLRRVTGIVLAGVLALAFFLTANPFALLDFDSFRDGLSEQSAASSDGGGKLGLTGDSGILYYLGTTTWGLGWLPAAGGARRRGRAGRARLAPRARARALDPRLPRLHGHAGPLLRPLAAARLPAAVPARRLRHGAALRLGDRARSAGRARRGRRPRRACCCARRGSCS